MEKLRTNRTDFKSIRPGSLLVDKEGEIVFVVAVSMKGFFYDDDVESGIRSGLSRKSKHPPAIGIIYFLNHEYSNPIIRNFQGIAETDHAFYNFSKIAWTPRG